MVAMVFLLVIVFALALLVWADARRRITHSGVPDGTLVFQDADQRCALHRPLVSSRYGLTGKPDYLVETNEGMVPVEVKSHDSLRSGPYPSDIAQLTAYCVLVEDAIGVTPPYAIIQYTNRLWRIQVTRQMRKEVLRAIDEMRCARQSPSVHRDHMQPGRCRACGFRDVCGERIE
jgi:CRISPR-associated exonuclease Cas4